MSVSEHIAGHLGSFCCFSDSSVHNTLYCVHCAEFRLFPPVRDWGKGCEPLKAYKCPKKHVSAPLFQHCLSPITLARSLVRILILIGITLLVTELFFSHMC